MSHIVCIKISSASLGEHWLPGNTGVERCFSFVRWCRVSLRAWADQPKNLSRPLFPDFTMLVLSQAQYSHVWGLAYINVFHIIGSKAIDFVFTIWAMLSTQK